MQTQAYYANMRKPTGRPKKEDVARRLEHILEVAETLFVQVGYQATSIDTIARAAGISKKTIYGKFGSKSGLFVAIVQRVTARLVGPGLPLEDDLPLFEGLVLRAEMILRATHDPGAINLNILTFREGRLFPELSRSIAAASDDAYRRPVEAYLACCARRGLIMEADYAFVAQSFLVMLTFDTVIAEARGEVHAMSVAEQRAHAHRISTFFARALQQSDLPSVHETGSGPTAAVRSAPILKSSR